MPIKERINTSSIAPQKSKSRASTKPRSKQRNSDTEPESGELTIGSVSNQVRSSISKWVKNQPTPEFKCLKENSSCFQSSKIKFVF